MKVKVTPFKSVLVCDNCDEEVGEGCVKDKLYHCGSEQLCRDCIPERYRDCILERYDEVDIDDA